jgi:hypothetical protein
VSIDPHKPENRLLIVVDHCDIIRKLRDCRRNSTVSSLQWSEMKTSVTIDLPNSSGIGCRVRYILRFRSCRIRDDPPARNAVGHRCAGRRRRACR